jgi:hypothetical protein
MTDEAHSPLESNDPKESNVRLNRPLGDEEFKSKLEMTKAFCDTAKIYVQISSAGLAVPLLLSETILGKTRSDTGLGHVPCSLVLSWAMFLISIGCGKRTNGSQ